MSLNFSAGDTVRADFSYILDPANKVPAKTVQHLLILSSGSARISEIGYIKVENQLTSRPLPIHIFPLDSANPLFRKGQGTILYFTSETQINSSLQKV